MGELRHRLFDNMMTLLHVSTSLAFYKLSECQSPLFYSMVRADIFEKFASGQRNCPRIRTYDTICFLHTYAKRNAQNILRKA